MGSVHASRCRRPTLSIVRSRDTANPRLSYWNISEILFSTAEASRPSSSPRRSIPRAVVSRVSHIAHTVAHKHAGWRVLSRTQKDRQLWVALRNRGVVRLDKLAVLSARMCHHSTHRVPALAAPTGEKCKRISLTAAGNTLVNTDAIVTAKSVAATGATH